MMPIRADMAALLTAEELEVLEQAIWQYQGLAMLGSAVESGATYIFQDASLLLHWTSPGDTPLMFELLLVHGTPWVTGETYPTGMDFVATGRFVESQLNAWGVKADQLRHPGGIVCTFSNALVRIELTDSELLVDVVQGAPWYADRECALSSGRKVGIW